MKGVKVQLDFPTLACWRRQDDIVVLRMSRHCMLLSK